MGYQVITAQNGCEELKLFRNNSIRLVLTALEMPGFDGWPVFLSIRAQTPDTPILIGTALDKEQVSERLKENHVDRVSFKPFGEKEVKEIFRKLLANQCQKRLKCH